MEFPIREDREHNLFVCGLSEKDIRGIDEFNASFLPASRNRSALTFVCLDGYLFLNKTIILCHSD